MNDILHFTAVYFRLGYFAWRYAGDKETLLSDGGEYTEAMIRLLFFFSQFVF